MGDSRYTWTFLSNHGHVLVAIAETPDIRLSELARKVGIGERAVQSIVNDLVDGGYVTRTRIGRRNTYAVHGNQHFRHPIEAGHAIGDLLTALADHRAATPTAAS